MKQKVFYFKIEDKIYSIKHSSLSLIPYFQTIVQMNPDESLTEETAVEVPVVVHNGLKINVKYLFDIVMLYVNYWEKTPKQHAYIKEDRVPEGFITHILNPYDLKIIEDYVNNEIQDAIGFDHTKNVYLKISACNLLLTQVDAYLHMDGFANKIYAYITCLLRECFLDDVEKIQNDEYFIQLQSETSEYWEEKYGHNYNKNGEKVGKKMNN